MESAVTSAVGQGGGLAAVAVMLVTLIVWLAKSAAPKLLESYRQDLKLERDENRKEINHLVETFESRLSAIMDSHERKTAAFVDALGKLTTAVQDLSSRVNHLDSQFQSVFEATASLNGVPAERVSAGS
jgi:nitric oxide reductase activation protein